MQVISRLIQNKSRQTSNLKIILTATYVKTSNMPCWLNLAFQVLGVQSNGE